MKKILVIDDDEQILEAVKIVLSTKGYQVIILENPNQAAAEIKVQQPNLILLDLYMAGIDGREVISQLRLEGELQSTPVILMSADAELKQKSKIADAILKKPFDINELEVLVAKFLT